MIQDKASHFRWYIIGLIFLICIINYIDRASMSYTITFIAKDLQLNAEEMGLILGVFSIGYVISALAGGIIMDKNGPKLTIALAISLWSVITAATGLCSNLHQLLVLRFLLGFAEGPMFPALARVISDWLPNEQKSLAFAFSLISVPLSLSFSGPLVTHLLSHHVWQDVYFILGAISLCSLPIWLYFFKNTPEESPFVNTAEAQLIATHGSHTVVKTTKMAWSKILLHPTLLVNNIAYFIFGFYLFFFMNWLPAYLQQVYHFSLQAIGWLITIPWITAVFMMLGLAYLSDRIRRMGYDLRRSRTYLILFSQLAAASALAFLIYFSPEHLLWFLSLAIGFVMSANSLYYAVVSDIIKPRAATALGIMVWYFALAGFIAPYLAGVLIKLYGDFKIIFIFMIILVLLSSLVLTLFHNRSQQIIYE